MIVNLFLYYCTFATDVITRWKEDGSQSENELAQEAGFSVLEDLHPLQCVQVNVNGNLRFEFVCVATSEQRTRPENDIVSL